VNGERWIEPRCVLKPRLLFGGAEAGGAEDLWVRSELDSEATARGCSQALGEAQRATATEALLVATGADVDGEDHELTDRVEDSEATERKGGEVDVSWVAVAGCGVVELGHQIGERLRGEAGAVVADGPAVCIEVNGDAAQAAGEVLIDGVADQLFQGVLEAKLIDGAEEHYGSLSNGMCAADDLDVAFAVVFLWEAVAGTIWQCEVEVRALEASRCERAVAVFLGV